MTHTPGPWEVRPYGKGLVGSASQLTACVFPYPEDEVVSVEMIANTNLIAAAPELLAACEDMVRHWNDGDGVSFVIIERAERAIAKARGE